MNCWRPPRKTWTASKSVCSGQTTRCAALANRQGGRRDHRQAQDRQALRDRYQKSQLQLRPQRQDDHRAGEAQQHIHHAPSLAAEQADAATTVRSYRASPGRARLPLHETVMELRPVFRWTAARLPHCCRACFLLSRMAHARTAPLLFDDHERPAARTQHTSPVAKADRSQPHAARPPANRPGRWAVWCCRCRLALCWTIWPR